VEAAGVELDAVSENRPVSAFSPRIALARRLGPFLLTETIEERPDIGFSSYDRRFPNQDTMALGGFGNLIALSVQRRARDQGNSVSLGEHLSPRPDRRAFLAGVSRVGRDHAERFGQEAEQSRRAAHNAGVQATLRDERRASARTERAAIACAPSPL
jgi:hypothetical protein